MFFDKNKKIKKRLELEQLKEDLLLCDFILKMKEYNIHLNKSDKRYSLHSSDLILDINDNFVAMFNYHIRDNALIVQYYQNISFLEKVFRNYYNISAYSRQINITDKDKIVQNENHKLYHKIAKNFSEMSNEYINIFMNRSHDGDYSSIYKPINGPYENILSSKTFFPRIVFKDGELHQELILNFIIKDSPFIDLAPNKNIIINIIDKEKYYEIDLYIESFSIKIANYIISKDVDFDVYSQDIINIIKSVGITKLGKETLDIESYKDFNNEKAETLKMLGY